MIANSPGARPTGAVGLAVGVGLGEGLALGVAVGLATGIGIRLAPVNSVSVPPDSAVIDGDKLMKTSYDPSGLPPPSSEPCKLNAILCRELLAKPRSPALGLPLVAVSRVNGPVEITGSGARNN